MNSKYNWNEIVKDSKKIIRDTTKNGNRKLISTMKELYDRLKFQYEKKGKEVPRYVLYSEKIRKEFNIDRHKKNIQLELYQPLHQIKHVLASKHWKLKVSSDESSS